MLVRIGLIFNRASVQSKSLRRSLGMFDKTLRAHVRAASLAPEELPCTCIGSHQSAVLKTFWVPWAMPPLLSF